MKNVAFQNSLRNKDSERFTASLREGAVLEDKSYLQETFSNVVPSTKKLVSETYEMIKHPIQTAKSLYELGSGVVQLAIPGEQGNENVAKAAGQYFADRYGSLEKAKESLKNDPAGVLTEVLGIAAGGAGLSKAVVTGAVKATAPIITNIKKNKVVKIDPTPERKNIVESMPQNAETNSFTMYHGDSMLDTKGGTRSLDAKGLYVPQKSFNTNEPLSLAIDKSNARSYASTIIDKTGSSGFLYEVSIPKKVLNGLFDPFNKNHVDIFNKRINIMLKKGDAEVSYDSMNWNKVKDKEGYIKSAYTDPMQLKDVQGSASSNNWSILEQPDVVAALKKEGFTGTWQKEAALTSQRVKGTDGGYDQIQIFDGSSVDIITNNTKNIYRGTDGSYSISSLDSFLKSVDTSKQGGVNIQTAEQFNKMLKDAIDAGEDIIFDGKKVDLKDIDRNQGGITTEPWGGANGSLYGAPTNREPAAPLNVQEQTKQVFNSTPRLNEGGTPTQGIDEIVVTGKRTGKSVNNPTSVLHPNYNTWQAGMSSYIPEEIVEGDYLNARLGGGKNVFGQYKGNKTKEQDLTEREADYLRYTDAVESKEPKYVSVNEGIKNFVDNVVDTFSNPLNTVKGIEQESKKLVDNIIETGGLPTVNSSLNSIVNSKTGERLNDIDENTNRFFGTDTRETAAGNIRNKYGSTDKFLSSLKADTVGTLSDIGLGAVAVALGTRFGAPASTVALAPLINKYSR